MTAVNVGGQSAPVTRRRVKKNGAMTPVPTAYSGPGRQFFVSSDWVTNILAGATSAQPNLDDARNVATLKRIASRYDVISIVDPNWHNYGWQIRDRLRQYAAEQGRRIICLRYMSSMFVHWYDQEGMQTILPSAGVITTGGVTQDASQLLTTASGGQIKGRGNDGYFMKPNNAKAMAAVRTNVVERAKGWDGIFVDEVAYSYKWLRGTGEEAKEDPSMPAGGVAYENAKRDQIKDITTALTAAGKLTAANIDPYTTLAGGVHWPTVICQDSPTLRYPFVEAMWCVDWESVLMTQSHKDWVITKDLADWLRWCQGRVHEPVINTHSIDPNVIRYGTAYAVAAGGRDTILCSQEPNHTSDEYADEPQWLPEFDKVRTLWNPTGPASSGTDLVTRAYPRGQAVADTKTGVGYILDPGQEPPSTAATPPSGAVIFRDTFDTDASAWPSRWTAGLALAGATATVAGGKGVMKVGTTSPGIRTQRYNGSQFANFHALFSARLSGAGTTTTVMYRSGDPTLDQDNAYGLALWPGTTELTVFDANWNGTTLASVSKGIGVGEDWWVRLVVSGTSHKARLWHVGDPEPAAWDINVTNSVKTTAGWWGFSTAGYDAPGPGSTCTVDDLIVAVS